MKSVLYETNVLLPCAACNGEVILCVDDSLIASGAPYIAATIATTDSYLDCCGKTRYSYGLTYDELLLVDPDAGLACCDIGGLFCKGCLTTYLDYRFDNLPAPVVTGFWRQVGNAGTLATDFCGTTDAMDFTIGTVENQNCNVKVYNVVARRTQPGTNEFGTPRIIDGYYTNSADALTDGTTIGGGGADKLPNIIANSTGSYSDYSTISGGVNNSISGYAGTIGGGNSNSIVEAGTCTIAGGASNSINGQNDGTPLYNFIGAGNTNVLLYAGYSVVGGGNNNKIRHLYSGNDILYSSILGGNGNEILQNLRDQDPTTSRSSVILGGDNNLLTNSAWSTIGGGEDNAINSVNTSTMSEHNSICSGYSNLIHTYLQYSAVGNRISRYNVISGGTSNGIKGGGNYNTLGGGFENVILALNFQGDNEYCNGNFLGGGASSSIVDGKYCGLVGGQSNGISQHQYSFIGGGTSNQIGDSYSTKGVGYNCILGGKGNAIYNRSYSSILGGYQLIIGSNSCGFQAYSAGMGTNKVNLDSAVINNVAYFGDVDVMVANIANSARKVKWYSPNTQYDFSGATYSSIEAQAQAANIEYKLPAAAGIAGQQLTIDTVVGNVVTLKWA